MVCNASSNTIQKNAGGITRDIGAVYKNSLLDTMKILTVTVKEIRVGIMDWTVKI